MSDRIERRGEVITGEALHLRANDLIFECRLVDCQLRIDHPRDATLFSSTFVNTTLQVKGTSTESWKGCFFDSCTFEGKYYSCLFGNASDQCPLTSGLRNCDFTGASLHLCEFLNCASDDLRLPSWPHITVCHPRQNADDFADLISDPVLARIHGAMEITSPRVIAVTYQLPSYVQKEYQHILKGWEVQKLIAKARSEPPPPEPTVSLETIRALLQRKPYILM
jgi:hypothetical protein